MPTVLQLRQMFFSLGLREGQHVKFFVDVHVELLIQSRHECVYR